MLTSQRIKSQWPLRWTKLSQWHSVFLLMPTFSRLWDHQIPDLQLCDHRTQLQTKNEPSLQRTFYWRGTRKTPSEREDTGSPLGPVTLLFPSSKFPFPLPDCSACSLYPHLLYSSHRGRSRILIHKGNSARQSKVITQDVPSMQNKKKVKKRTNLQPKEILLSPSSL